jgi:hypothetical protein
MNSSQKDLFNLYCINFKLKNSSINNKQLNELKESYNLNLILNLDAKYNVCEERFISKKSKKMGLISYYFLIHNSQSEEFDNEKTNLLEQITNESCVSEINKIKNDIELNDINYETNIYWAEISKTIYFSHVKVSFALNLAVIALTLYLSLSQFNFKH